MNIISVGLKEKKKRKKRESAKKRIKRNISELFLCRRRDVKKQNDAVHENHKTRQCDVADKCLKAVSSGSTPEQLQKIFLILYFIQKGPRGYLSTSAYLQVIFWKTNASVHIIQKNETSVCGRATSLSFVECQLRTEIEIFMIEI